MKVLKYFIAAILATCIFCGGCIVAEYEAPGNSTIEAAPQTPTEEETEAAPQAPTEEETETAAAITYVLNRNTRKFHFPDCASVKQMKESNKIYTDKDREAVINMGYKYCQRCCP